MMLSSLNKYATIIASVAALIVPIGFVSPLLAAENQSSTTQVAVRSTSASWYQVAEAKLPNNFYVIYRITERLIRANKVDSPYLRIILSQDYSVNATANTAYLIVLYQGLLDITEGDTSALAFIIAHEIGHYVKDHYNRVYALEQDANSKLREILSSSKNQAEAARRIEALRQKIIEQLRAYELEADQIGYLYSVRAGFDPEAGSRGFKLLEKMPGGTMASETHPSISDRLAALEALKAKYPPETLRQEGLTQIERTQPLTYELAEDKHSLRINSQPTISSVDDIHRRLGQNDRD
ncbi:M48 family metallopeptidase [Microseira wollei]|uniref:Peptidase M48, Ste24p n=1 Tax=Microseira wollei NIES-4236 TaxID=2530354 RepID=A0AAV3X8Z8_9CYAN|nr:M48 family metallopeptidase [Microseira wollei]GET36839.1 peptidase M48, Ste24p [Microseira wollei NIES-4236]